MEQLSVGRSTVREALNGLSLLGVIEIRHGQGAFVTDKAALDGATREINSAVMSAVSRDLVEARRVIETEVARLAAARRTDEDIRELEEAIAQHKASLDRDEAPVEVSTRFHMLIAEAAHNEILATVMRSFQQLMAERGPKLYESIPRFGQWELAQHSELLRAIVSGNGDEAASLIRQHVDAIAERYARVGEG